MRDQKIQPIVLMILDGWGMSDKPTRNAIHAANKPNWDQLWADYPHTLVNTSGTAVGLPDQQMGNSEVGHLNLGAGRVVYQEMTRINRAIETGEFFTNPVLTEAVDTAREQGKAVHLCGLLSPGGVHSHEEHIHAMLKLAVQRGAKQLYVHAFLDGRDTPPKSAEASLRKLQQVLHTLGTGRIVSLVGRYYAMDRDQRWERTAKAHDLLVSAQAEQQHPDALSALQAAYARGETDEFVQPTLIGEPVCIQAGDVLINMNYRADRARQITQALTEKEFRAFAQPHRPDISRYVCLTEYNAAFDVPVAYPPERLENTFGEYIATQGLRQLRLAETEKYAHVTFFFNGGVETPNPGEERLLIPSPKVSTYDLQPEMSAGAVTEKLVDAINSQTFDAIIVNYANGDMVGHTGQYAAAVQAIETLDQCIGRVVTAVDKTGAELLITADHGNAEQMYDDATDQPYTAHTTNPVPLIYRGDQVKHVRSNAALCDVAPTLLDMMGLAKPQEMTGCSLLLR